MVLPLRAILFQLLLLLIAIAIEAVIYHRKLKLPRQTSVEYSISLNLLSTVLGWIAFFMIQTQLSPSVRIQLISRIFFDSFYGTFNVLPMLVILVTVSAFGFIYLVELKGLDLLQALLKTSQSEASKSLKSKSPFLKTRLKKALRRTSPSQAIVVLLANAWSHAVILSLLFLRSFLQT